MSLATDVLGNVTSNNRYSLSFNNPTRYNDPSGHCPTCVLGLIGAGVGALVAYGSQVYNNYQNNGGDLGAALTTNINGAEIVKGAVVGGLVGLTAGVALEAVGVIGAAGMVGTVAETAGAVAEVACADGDCTNEVNSITQTVYKISQSGNNIWAQNPFARGKIIEDYLGQNLPESFPTIDRFSNGTATSIKSINLLDESYQSISTLTNVIKGYITKVAEFQGGLREGVQIKPNMILARELRLAIPPNISQSQFDALRYLQQWADSVGVRLNIVTVK